jgi:hypothetical protein
VCNPGLSGALADRRHVTKTASPEQERNDAARRKAGGWLSNDLVHPSHRQRRIEIELT